MAGAPLIEPSFAALRSIAGEFAPDLVLRDGMELSACPAAEALDIPHVSTPSGCLQHDRPGEAGTTAERQADRVGTTRPARSTRDLPVRPNGLRALAVLVHSAPATNGDRLPRGPCHTGDHRTRPARPARAARAATGRRDRPPTGSSRRLKVHAGVTGNGREVELRHSCRPTRACYAGSGKHRRNPVGSGRF
jgi:hypothetical protein